MSAEEVAQFGRRIADTITVPAENTISNGGRRPTRTGVGMNATDEKKHEDEETGEWRRGEE